MSFSAKAVAFLLSLRCVYASLSSRDLVLENLPNSTDLLYPLSNQTSSNRSAPVLSDLHSGIIKCDRYRPIYLDPDSCENALKKIPLFGEPGHEVEFRARKDNPSRTVASLPIRWLSDDGKCAIDLTILQGHHQFDLSNGDEIAGTADIAFEECVVRERTGVTVRNFSARNKLQIRFSSYESRIQNVVCDAAPAQPLSDLYKMRCKDALLLLPTGLRTWTFNTTRASSDFVKIQLPRREPRGTGPLLVDMIRDSDVNQEKWWEIWVAGVAVYTKCISNGLKGTAVNLGDLKEIFIRLGL